ncbi:MAG: HEAT repeat domain-containing protein [Heliobacteriaceae bacterium]|nr:HEAT repeat domain-containing protein [Heliobacteriaceae bacterium]
MKEPGVRRTFWRRWLPFGAKTPGEAELVRKMLQGLCKGFPPEPAQLRRLAATTGADRACWWQEAVQALATSQTGAPGLNPAFAGAAWRLARILGLETYWQEVLATGPVGEKEALVETLGLLPVPEAVPLLTILVKDRSPAVGLAATLVLAQRPEPVATDFFISLLTQKKVGPWPDRAARGLAARRQVEGHRVWQALLGLAAAEPGGSRIRAWEVLAFFGPPAAGEEEPRLDPALSRGLTDPESGVRAAAAAAAGSLLRTAVLPDLVKRLTDPDGRVRAEAAQALGRFAAAGFPGDYREMVHTGLVRALTDPDWRVGGWAREALRSLPEIEVADV